MYRKILPLAAAGAILCGAAIAQAGTVENLERERAMLVDMALSPSMAPAERHEKLAMAGRRLVDLERMVLRDKSLTGRNTLAVKRAFENYDLTFLVHAATERNQGVVDHWLEQLNLSTASIMNARRGRR